MVRSMTGFGAGRAESSLGSLTVEIRSVNNRFLDLSIRVPTDFVAWEGEVRHAVQRRLQRGKVTLVARFNPIAGPKGGYALNLPLLEMLESACRARGESASLTALLGIEGVVIPDAAEAPPEELRELLTTATNQALDGIAEDRAREGVALRDAIESTRDAMVQRVAAIDAVRTEVATKYRARLKERIDDMLAPQGIALDPGRLAQEIALFADKADLSEETTRLAVHLQRLGELLADGGGNSTGRPLDFLSQEILREVNTIGSKCRDLDITNDVLELKNLVESMKEQVANIE